MNRINFAARNLFIRRAGFTLIEVVVASAVGAVIAGGSMIAFVAASQMMRARGAPSADEAVVYARGTLETYRNMIACDSPWFNPATCAPVIGAPPGVWVSDPFPLPAPGLGTDSIRNTASPKRCYRVVQQDCDGVGGPGDCLGIEAQVCWNGEVACSCP